MLGGYAAQQALYAAPVPAHKDGLRALFDLSFTEMVTPLVVKILYVLSMIVGILWWLFAILIGTGAASIDPYFNSGSSVMLVLGILLGWIPGVIIVLGTRMISEFVLSSLKTQRAAEDILKRLESQ
ncbi:PF14110 domain protein [Propionibacterium acidifaciens]